MRAVLAAAPPPVEGTWSASADLDQRAGAALLQTHPLLRRRGWFCVDVAKGTLSLVTWALHPAALPGVGLLGLLLQQLQLAAEGHGHTAARHRATGRRKCVF